MRRAITITLLGALSVTSCSSQVAGGPATPPAAAPTPVAPVPQSTPIPTPLRTSPVATPTDHTASPTPSTHTTAPTCGAPTNPYGLNLCGRGKKVDDPPSDVCQYFTCIPSFSSGTGYMAQCKDGKFSMSGGRPGSCSSHKGEQELVFRD